MRPTSLVSMPGRRQHALGFFFPQRSRHRSFLFATLLQHVALASLLQTAVLPLHEMDCMLEVLSNHGLDGDLATAVPVESLSGGQKLGRCWTPLFVRSFLPSFLPSSMIPSFLRSFLRAFVRRFLRPSARLRPSVRPSARPPARPSVRPSVRPFVRSCVCVEIHFSSTFSMDDDCHFGGSSLH